MTFKEMIEDDKENAFYDWISVREAKELEIIPKEFHEYFSDTCSCDSENIIKTSRTQIMCCNPKCIVKTGYALAEMLTRFGIKGLKAATCSKIYAQLVSEDTKLKAAGKEGLFKYGSFVEAIAVPLDKYPAELRSSAKGIDFYYACNELMKERFTFPKMVANLAIPELSKDAETLFAGVNSFLDIYKELKTMTVQEFCTKRGFQAPAVAYYLRHSLMDIAVANDLFLRVIKPEGLLHINICMTGSIRLHGASTTKDKYIKRCNELCIDKTGNALFEFKMNSAKESNAFILYSRPSGDSKYVTGERRGTITDEFGMHPVLMHTDTFYEFLERIMGLWNQLTESGMTDPMTEFWKQVPQVMQALLNPKTSMKTLEKTSMKNLEEILVKNSEKTSETLNCFK